MYRTIPILVSLCLTLLPLTAPAEEDGTIAALRERVAELVPDTKPSDIRETPVAGLYQVRFGARLFYITADGEHVLEGTLVEVDTGRNLTEAARAVGRRELLAQMDEKDMVVYPAKGEEKHEITVFTDVECPYCRRLHDEVEALNEAGVTVRYLMFPRSGQGSPGYDKMVRVWCADDPAAAFNRAKADKPVKAEACETPVREHMTLGHRMGVRGTPAILLEGGEMLPGYRPAERILQALEQAGT
ncbi:thiol:disulfide interchange protein DsbC [Ectothiorhodospira mobilis]|uniref:Thiol:disulfide interchange protein n=1 Tax=Ectothiorhodospira mobilis TaxID=195064 RepID=A0A1I4Q7Z3_ECTMO|nr:DsbC family protein [Ectothiorhodospira mobilis]SFM35753.1 thiol:disulfide interchange protein DsbC [Ectothiorhodospira mobilis]